MELREPRRKRQCNLELQQPFPIFIESEIGIPVDNWVPVICTGIFNGFGVIIKEPAEISALHNMGNFGKGSNSRSRPYIMRNNSKLPHILMKRQYLHRKKWMNSTPCLRNKDSKKRCPTNSSLLEDIYKLYQLLDGDDCIHDNNYKNKSEIIDILSSDEENLTSHNTEVNDPCTSSNSEAVIELDQVIPKLQNTNNCEHSEDPDEEKSIHDLNFPPNSVVVIPDSDSDNDDYFKDLASKLYIDESHLEENLVLTLQEAYFLAYGLGCLQILDDHEKPLNLEESWILFCKAQEDFCRKYIVYHYYRSKGWIVKPGIKFGGDFLLYKEGQPFYHASYIVLVDVVENESNEFSKSILDWKTLLGLVRMAGTAVKEVIIAQVIVPSGETLDNLCEGPETIGQFKVLEVLLRRWISKHERVEHEND